MNEKSGGKLKYEVQDVFNMAYKAEKFGMVLDKGCLDAIYPESNKENWKRIENFFIDV